MRRPTPPWSDDRRAQLLLLPAVAGQSVYLLFDLEDTLFGWLLGVYGLTAFAMYWTLRAIDRRKRL